MRLIDRLFAMVGLVTVNRMEARIMELRRIDAVNRMEFLDELDDRFRLLDIRSAEQMEFMHALDDEIARIL